VSGEVRHFFDDILIKGSHTLPANLVDRLQPWELTDLEPFREEFLSGHLAERYAVSLKDGFHEAKEVMADYITGLIHRDIGGDHQRIQSRRTNHVGVTFKHVLLPIWVANYRYRDQLFRVLISGQSGRVAGDRPWSAWKIVRIVLLVLFAILLALVLVNKAKGQMANPIQKEFSELRTSDAAARDGSDWDRRPTPGLMEKRGRGGVVSNRSGLGDCAVDPCNLQDAQLGTAVHDPNVRRGFSPNGCPETLQALDPKP